MDDSVLVNKMDFPQYIEKTLLEVTDLAQRRQLRETLLTVFTNLYEHVEGEYQGLEQRILQAEHQAGQPLFVHTSLIPRSQYDATDEYLFPMDPADVTEARIDSAQLSAQIECQEPYPLYRIMMAADYQVIQEIVQEKHHLTGTILTDQGRFDAQFMIEKDDSYLQQLMQLYPVFLNNYRPWNTACAPYLHKMFRVLLCSAEEWNGAAQIEEVTVDFGEYERFVQYDCIPVWNITSKLEKSSSYPEPCLDHVHYQHIIYSHRLDQQAQYLVANREYPLTDIKQMKGDLMITCAEEYPVKWLLYQLKKPSQRKYPYPIFTNEIRKDFSDAVDHRFQTTVKTRAELQRFLTGLGYDQIVTFVTYQLVDQPLTETETYLLDTFIADEFRTAGQRSTMILIFEPIQPDDFCNRDIMSYLVAQVQKLFPEYHCIGQMQ